MKKQIHVSSKTAVPQLAASIIHSTEEFTDVEVRAIGAGAVSQAYKACAVARGIIGSKGRELLIRPGFDMITDKEDGKEKTVMVFVLVIM